MHGVSDIVLVPLKRFDRAKSRLRRDGATDVDELATSLARGVILACRPRPVTVVCESDDVEHFARALGVGVARSRLRGVNAAVSAAYRAVAPYVDRVIVAHGDLQVPEGLGSYDFPDGATFVADRRGEGTNVLALPRGLDFHFAYGARSLLRHVNEAQRLGLSYRVERESPWRFDLDVTSDRTLPEEHSRGPRGPLEHPLSKES